jgi:ABC-2 type transport system ATP-binding protein
MARSFGLGSRRQPPTPCSDTGDPLVVVSALSLRYGRRRALTIEELHIASGEYLAVLGHNGSGKSSLLRLLAGVVRPTGGLVRVADEDPLSVGARRRVGYVPEQPAFLPSQTVSDVLHLAARLYRLPRSARRGAVADAVELFGLTEVERRLTGGLSLGFRKRVALAQALLHDPELLLLDEPTGGLDIEQARILRRHVRQLPGDRTVVLATHIETDVPERCRRFVLLEDGEVRYDGPVDKMPGSRRRDFSMELYETRSS